MLATLVIYLVVNGNMQTIRIPQVDMAACQAASLILAPKLHAVHAECKLKKVRQ